MSKLFEYVITKTHNHAIENPKNERRNVVKGEMKTGTKQLKYQCVQTIYSTIPENLSIGYLYFVDFISSDKWCNKSKKKKNEFDENAKTK